MIIGNAAALRGPDTLERDALGAALRLIVRGGGLSDIGRRTAQQLDIAESAIRERFADDDVLLQAIIERLEREFVDPVVTLLRSRRSGPARTLARLNRRLAEIYDTEPELACGLYVLWQDLCADGHPAALRVSELVQNVERGLGEVLVFLPHIREPDVTASAYLLSLWGMGVHACRCPGLVYNIEQLTSGLMALMGPDIVGQG